MPRLAVLASGRGSNLQAILDAQREGRLGPGRVALVVSDNEDARALDRAKAAGVETLFLDPDGVPRERYDERLLEALRTRGIDHVVLAGFMRILSGPIVDAFRNKILNIHPSLLPSFPGLDAQEQALKAGVRIAGATTHFVDETVDGGPIILQSAVPVRAGDTVETLSKRILRTEHIILPESVRLMCEGRLSITGDGVEIKGEVRVPGTDALVPEVTP